MARRRGGRSRSDSGTVCGDSPVPAFDIVLGAVVAEHRLLAQQGALAGGQIDVIDPHGVTKDVAPTRSLGALQFGLPARPADISSDSNAMSSGWP